MKQRQKRIALIVGGLVTIGVATALVMNALNSNIAVFVTPTEVLSGKAPQDKAFRIGGLVKEGKGAVALGRIKPDGTFAATEVLAKHDENYMPAEAQHAIDEAQKTAPTYKPQQTKI
jgi:cytochrome c-type biogenesis protein CcmE